MRETIHNFYLLASAPSILAIFQDYYIFIKIVYKRKKFFAGHSLLHFSDEHKKRQKL